MEPKPGCCVPCYTAAIAAFTNKHWGNETVLRYLQTGSFRWEPLWALFPITYQEPGGKPGCDHFGLNYYSKCVCVCVCVCGWGSAGHGAMPLQVIKGDRGYCPSN
jgi:hypothetical protein